MHGSCRDWIQRKVELVVPPELESCFGESIIPALRVRVLLGEIGGMCGNLVRDHTSLDVVSVRKTQMLLWRHVAQQCSSKRPNRRSADGRSNVIIAGCNIRGQRSYSRRIVMGEGKKSKRNKTRDNPSPTTPVKFPPSFAFPLLVVV